MSHLVDLARYKSWADDRLFAALARLPEAELTAPRPIVFGSILGTLNHVYATDQVWQARLHGRPHGFSAREPAVVHGFQALREFQRWIDAWYMRYASGLSLDCAARDKVMRFDYIDGAQGAMARGDILMHVVNHTTYHRGHVTDMLYAIGMSPPATDLPAFMKG